MSKEIYDEVKRYSNKKLNLPLINVVFIIDLILLNFKDEFNKNYLIWYGFNFGEILNDIGMMLYSPSIFLVIILILMIIVCAIAGLFEYTSFFDFLPSNDYSDGTTISYNPVSAAYKLLRLVWYLIHGLWIVYFTVMLLSGTNKLDFFKFSEQNQENNFILLWVNIFILCFLLLKALFRNKYDTLRYGRKSIDPYNESSYVILNVKKVSSSPKNDMGETYYFVKDITLNKPEYYLVETVPDNLLDSLSPKETHFSKKPSYHTINHSDNFEEIKYEFDVRK